MHDQWKDKSWTRHNFDDMKDINTYLKKEKKRIIWSILIQENGKYIKPLKRGYASIFQVPSKLFSHACFPIV